MKIAPYTKFANNPKATFDYHILKKFEAGMKLQGSEVKSILDGRLQLRGSYCKIINSEVFLLGSHLPNPENVFHFNRHEETRERKLLLNKSEIKKLEKELQTQGTTLIVLDVYYSESKKIKCSLALAQGKKDYDKREALKKKDLKRQQDRVE